VRKLLVMLRLVLLRLARALAGLALRAGSSGLSVRARTASRPSGTLGASWTCRALRPWRASRRRAALDHCGGLGIAVPLVGRVVDLHCQRMPGGVGRVQRGPRVGARLRHGEVLLPQDAVVLLRDDVPVGVLASDRGRPAATPRLGGRTPGECCDGGREGQDDAERPSSGHDSANGLRHCAPPPVAYCVEDRNESCDASRKGYLPKAFAQIIP
jgi:hypothetical protein